MIKEQIRSLVDIYNERANTLKEKYSFIIEKDKKEYYKMLQKYEYFKDIMSESDFKEVLRLKRNRSNRRRRANKKIAKIRFYERPTIIFGTCTFNDMQFYKKNGKEIKERTRTTKVNNWIMSHFEYAVVNIDYGKKNEREHHHFVGVLKKSEELEKVKTKSKTGYKMYELKNKDYKLGFEPTLELVEYDPQDYNMKKLSNYLLKINNHENKSTTKNRRFRVLGEIKI